MRSLVIQSPESAAEDGTLVPLGSRAEILDALAARNTGPEVDGGDTLFGPGIRLEIRADEDPVTQIVLDIVDEDIAWDVIEGMAKAFKWSLLDLASGNTLSF
jgi:hypothetical protein